MRAIGVLLFSALSLVAIAACAPVPGDTYPKTALAGTCPALQGYPGCQSGADEGATMTALSAVSHRS